MYFCKECGAEVRTWSGKCPVCGVWDSLKETSSITGKSSKQKRKNIQKYSKTVKAEQIGNIDLKKEHRLKTDVNEFDGTLGGGIVPGMVVLIGGEPGIGKSTLMLQIANRIARKNQKVLYVSGEESRQQIKLRSNRLNIEAENLFLYCNTVVEDITKTIDKQEPNLIIIDSIQSVFMNSLDNVPGSITQIKESTALFARLAKQQNIPLFLIGHVTKEGVVAGPKLIEHVVDTVLYFESESQNQYKILRATKNRFGSTNEIGIFEMLTKGLRQVKNPSKLFVSEKSNNIGSAVSCVLEGSRAFLVEVQALVSPTNYGTSQRVAIGFDHKKLSVLLAVMEKNLGINLRQNDIFVNLTGGIKVSEPVLDLAVVAAVYSSFKDKILKPKSVFLGEIGLNGEIRTISQPQKRIKEARKLGFEEIFISEKTKNIQTKYKINHINQLTNYIF